MKHYLLALAISFLLVSQAHAAGPVSDADRKFVAMVSEGGMFELAVGALCAQQGFAQDIKDQANTEIHDHQLVDNKLRTIAVEANVPVAQALDASFQKEFNELKAMTGVAFDNAYLRDMEQIHDKDGAAFAEEAKSGTNPALRAFAAETQRIVERHIGELHAVGPQ